MPHAAKSQASQSCYDRLRSLLLYGQVPPGQRLREAHWAQQLGVNRTVCREAMVRLAHEGLLRAGDKGGYFCPVYEQADLDQIWETRRVLELAALDRLLTQPDRAAIAQELRATADTMEQLLQMQLYLGFIEADRQFHRQLVQRAGNDHLTRVYENAALPLVVGLAGLDQLVSHNGGETLREHRELAAAIEAGQASTARRILRQHLHGQLCSASPVN